MSLFLEVNILAYRFNNKVNRFVTRPRDPWAVDAQTQCDQRNPICTFLFLQIFPQLLRRIKMKDIPGILMAPNWPRRTWHMVIIQLLADSPYIILD